MHAMGMSIGLLVNVQKRTRQSECMYENHTEKKCKKFSF